MNLVITEPAEKDLKRLDPPAQQRIMQAIERLTEVPGTGDVKKLKGEGKLYRLRVGDWRVIFHVDRPADAIYVLHVRHRRDAYRP